MQKTALAPQGNRVDGVLNVNKGRGITSFGVVARVKKLTGEPHVGHAGTLDPQASGVLPVLLGQATRLVEYLAEASKTYRAQIELGMATDTYDAEGRVTLQGDISEVTRSQIEIALNAFRGPILQVPPMYSALKHEGRALYSLAREGKVIDRPARSVTIYRLELESWSPPLLNLEVECSKGTYIRSLAHDLGQALGCGGHLRTLVRQRYGDFDLTQAVTLEEIEAALASGDFSRLLYPPDSVLGKLPALVAGAETTRRLRGGLAIELPGTMASGPMRVYDPEGFLLAVLVPHTESGQWRPRKVFHEPNPACPGCQSCRTRLP
jgi:tRNA pseudouridine55 synthase